MVSQRTNSTLLDAMGILNWMLRFFALAKIACDALFYVYFDVLGLVKEVSETVVYEALVDSKMKIVTIGVWDDAGKPDGLVQRISELEGKVVVITGVKSQYRDGSLNLNTSKSSAILEHNSSGLDETMLQNVVKENCEEITVSNLRPQIDWEQPGAHTCLNMLAHTTNTDAMYQVRNLC
jgi:hypothetical protein